MAPDVFANSFKENAPSVSKKEFVIAGILTTVYGLEEALDCNTVSCLWLLHPRLAKRERMEPMAGTIITGWNKESQGSSSSRRHGLLAIAFDQRNHGTREVEKLANEDWRNGNPSHAQDMFSIFQGTAADTSLLIDYLPAYVSPSNEYNITSHLVLGVSLGGHAAWHCALHDQRINTAVVVIGCADYVRLMSHRAEKSKLQSWTDGEVPGSKFLGSRDFPKALQEAVARWDPAGLFLNGLKEKQRVPLMQAHLQGKRILNMAGGADKLVPHSCSEPFLDWLDNAIRPRGWFANRGVIMKDKVYDGVGHEMPAEMLEDAVDFINESLRNEMTTMAKI